MRHRPLLFSFCLLIGFCVQAIAAANLTAGEAKNHIGENATVCGVVASVHYAAGSRGTPTFVNLDKPYPNQVFTILIWGEDMPKFSSKPSTWEGKNACATGVISSYRGSPQIVAKSPGQIRVEEPKQR
jgi:DNA/RNA endonuclease YhcR with UshA esterase domain